MLVRLDGVGAFDHARHAQFLSRPYEVPELRELLPRVTAPYGSNSRFLWRDANGKETVVEQGEGGEQGDPLMPAHAALREAAGQLDKNHYLFAFLDNLYVV